MTLASKHGSETSSHFTVERQQHYGALLSGLCPSSPASSPLWVCKCSTGRRGLHSEREVKKMEQIYTWCEQGLYCSSTRFPRWCLVQLRPFVKCVIQLLWQLTEGLKCSAARNCAGAFNQYQQLLCSQQKHK